MSFTIAQSPILDVPMLVVNHYFYCQLIEVMFIHDSSLKDMTDVSITEIVEGYQHLTKKEKKTAIKLIIQIRDSVEFSVEFWNNPDLKPLFIKMLRFIIEFAREMKTKEDIDTLFGNKLEVLTDWFKDEPEQKYINMCNNMKQLKILVEDLLFREFCICNMVGRMSDDDICKDLLVMFLPCGFK